MATTRCAALLRGVNVGKGKRIVMADLRALCESLGFTGVRTLLNSGNVVFTTRLAPEKARRILEAAIETSSGFFARVTLFTAAELDDLVAHNPLLAIGTNHSRLQVAFLASDGARGKLLPLAAMDWQVERLVMGRRAGYLWCPEGVIESPLALAMARALKDEVTTRTWATVLKLQALTSGD